MTTETPTVKIGGKAYELRELTFSQLKKMWPIVKEKFEKQVDEQNPTEAFDVADAAVEIVSIALIKYHPELTPEYISDSLTASELKALPPSVLTLLEVSGLYKQGEAPPSREAQGAPSTATGTPSPQN